MAVYLVLFTISVGAILGYVYWNTAVLLERQGDETIKAEITGLAEQYRQGGLRQLVRTVASRSRNPSDNVYLLANVSGNHLAGNLNALPPGVTGGTGWTEFSYSVPTPKGRVPHLARAQFFVLAGGFKLVVGRDVQERRRFAQLIKRALIWALGLTLALGIASGIFLSRTLLRRVEAISQTSRAIMAGDLSERMAVSGTGDELDQLAASLNEMLEQIERLMTGMREVTDNVAHDLKTPLTRLRARVEDALRGGSKNEYKTALEQTLIESDDLLKTFNALLSIARLEAGEARAGLVEVDASQLVLDLAELYEPLAEDAGFRFTFEAEEGLRIKADRQLISQALANLIDNAMKYAQGPGSNQAPDIALSVRGVDNDVVLCVADNGPGVAKKDRDRVIDRFVRLDGARTKPGNGLGLSLAAGIAKLHNGQLRLEDNEPGLRVELILPAIDPDLALKAET
jgi:signal transduction histidine kinase